MVYFRREVFQIAALIMAVVSPTAVSGPTRLSTPDEVVWHWFSACSKGKKVELQVLLDGKAVYGSSFSACSMRRAEITPEPKQRILAFVLPKGGHRRLGVHTALEIEGNVWEAGGDPDAILLGVSFATKDRILLNAIHVVNMLGASQSDLAPGLVVKTFST